MSKFYNIEKKLPFLSFKDSTTVLIFGQVIVFLLNKLGYLPYEKILLNGQIVKYGEFWRLFTFIFIPVSDSFFFVLFAWYLYYLYGNYLERYWGSFKYNTYLLVAVLTTIGFAFAFPNMVLNNYYILLSIFFAFAFLNPNFEIYLFFILPVQIKWIALFSFFLIFGFTILNGSVLDIIYLIVAFLNFYLFFFKKIFLNIKYKKNKIMVKITDVEKKKVFHTCSTCGITDVDDKNLQFRYDSSNGKDLCLCENCLK